MEFICEYVQRGESIDYVNPGTEKIAAGDVVVMGTIAGVAVPDILPGETGAVAVEGVFDVPCGSASFAVGDKVDWDDAAKTIVAAADGIALGWIIRAPVNGKAWVKLVQG